MVHPIAPQEVVVLPIIHDFARFEKTGAAPRALCGASGGMIFPYSRRESQKIVKTMNFEEEILPKSPKMTETTIKRLFYIWESVPF
ncbi:MAG: hypothetical protein U0L91_01380 [Gemmiger sp.]|uniref:hypothetical protein n=1 Tax=Gemmiger sp. TaxID=2049027 RepID=UPI002E78B57A|nr:hypothetical protein [Gemmiger sp.]MEE0799911.1 hypothetical protein [Gemmiger sp.]